jgi:hypothetical protein
MRTIAMEAETLTPDQERRVVDALHKLIALQDHRIRQRAWAVGQEAAAPHRANDALGECKLVVDSDLYHAWRAQGWRPDDPSDVRFLLQRHPECAVRSQGTRVQVGYRNVRYSRNYGVISGAKQA